MDEADIPIEIHTLKLQDWLTSRRIVGKDAQLTLKRIRALIANALQDMPSSEALVELLKGKTIDYDVSKQIVEILKQTEKDTKSVFGTYGSKRMKDWQQILLLYQKDNVYLAELAQNYVRNIKFELPSTRKQINKLEQEAVDIEQQIDNIVNQITQHKNEQAKLYQQIGIRGEQNLRTELEAVIGRLPALLQESISNISKLTDAISLYEKCAARPNCLPLSKHLLQHGNTSVYWYVHNQAPLAVEETPVAIRLGAEFEDCIKKQSNDDAGIDFGDDLEIDFGGLELEEANIELDLPNADGDDIDWGGDEVDVCDTNNDCELPADNFGIVVERDGMDGGIARGELAYTLLDAPSYRECFLRELFELEAFLLIRSYELGQLGSASNIMFSLMENDVAAHDIATLTQYLQSVSEIIKDVTGNEQLRHLHQLKHSPKYAQLLALKIRQSGEANDKLHSKIESLKQRAVQAKATRLELQSALADLTATTKTLQTQLEQDISQRYKQRVVHILGALY